MAEPQESSRSASALNAFNPASRIAELNEIDQKVSALLLSAAEGTGILSNDAQTVTAAPKTLASAQARFTKASSAYFATLSEIEVRLRRQVYALEEAGLIEPGDDKDTKAGRALGGGNTGRSGGGSLDPSWLNARADDHVDITIRRELVDQAKGFLKRVEAGKPGLKTEHTETQGVEMKDGP
jgi:Mediator complex protein